MKLPIKKKYFDMIKNGEKNIEWRDAHITFICEETGETLQKKIKSAQVIEKESYWHWDVPEMTYEEWEEMFTDDFVIGFELK